MKYLGVDFDPVYLEQHEIKHITCGEFTALSENIFIMSCFSRNNSFENVPSRFIYEEADGSYLHDLFENEVCLVIRGNNALNVVVGCSHIGIANILSKISIFFNLPIKYVFGGIHLKEATDDVARHTIDTVLALGVENLYFNHCSGDDVLKLLNGSESSDADKHRLFKTGYLAAGASFSTL